MPHPLEAGTLRILRPNGSTAGTGFLVSKRLAVTCAHVVTAAKAKPGDVIKFKFHLGDLEAQEAKVLESGWSTENDVAILELTEKPPKWIHPIIMQSSRAIEGRAFQGLGYPNDGPVQARWVQGNIGGLVRVDQYLNPLLQIQGSEIDMGLSGSALVDHTTRKVIGMLTAYRDLKRPATAPQVRFAYSIPIETIWEVYPDIKKELPAYHPRSPLTEGIHLLPYDYANRIQNFLAEYLGTPEQPEPFGGREEALKKLDNWLEGNTQRLLLAAPAGRGKSALLVRWLDRLIVRDEIALVFVPISVRFNTNLASTFFASLGARLAYLHDREVPTDETTSTGIWRGLTSAYLTKPLTDERKLLIVLDGLDEADDWEATADLIPAELPINVRVVVSARFLAGDSDAQPWLSRLGWEHTGKASTLDLDPLDSNGVADVIGRMGFPLEELSHHVNIVTKLHYLSQGDPLLVNLYVEDLWSRGEKASRLRPEDLEGIKPGYEGYFKKWWDDQEKLWGDKEPLLIKRVGLVFNLLCSAMGALTTDDLLALDSENELNTYAIDDALKPLKRFVISIPNEHREKEIGYVLTHPKLRDYFWDKLAKKERVELETRFITWGESTMQLLIDNKLKPADTPRYLLQYYGIHLERAHAPVERFFPFVDYSYWHRAWFAYEGTYGGYLKDVLRLWEHFKALDRHSIDTVEKTPYLGKQIRCALIEASLHSLAGNIPHKLIALLVRNGIWTLPQTWVFIRQMPEDQKNGAIDALIPELDNHQLLEALQEAQTIQEKARVSILTKLAGCLLVGELMQILEAARAMKDEDNRAYVMIALVQRLPEVTDEVLDVAQAMKNEWARAYVLRALARNLPESKLVQILESARAIMDDGARARVLSVLARRLPGVTREALEAARAIQHPGDCANALIELAETLPKSELVQILEAAQAIQVEGARVRVLIELARSLPESALAQVLESARAMQDEEARVNLLSALAQRLPQIINEVLKAVRAIQDDWKRAQALGKLAQILQEAELSKLTEEALAIRFESYRASVLRNLVQRLPEDDLKQVLEATRALWNEGDRANLLSSLAQRLPELNAEALEAAQTIRHEKTRSNVLRDLAGHLPENKLMRVLQTTRKIRNGEDRTDVLLILAERLPELTSEALEGARMIQDDRERALVLMSLTKHLPEVTEEVLEAVQMIQQDWIRARVLNGLMRHVPEDKLSQLLESARAIQDEEYRVAVMSNLAQHLPEVKGESLEAACEALKTAQRFVDEGLRAVMVSSLAQYLPEDKLLEVLKSARLLQSEVARVEILSALAQRLPMITGEVLEAVRAIQDDGARANTLSTLAERLPEVIGDVLEVVRAIHNDSIRASVLSNMAKRLPEMMGEALEAARLIQDDRERVRALSAFAQHLTKSELMHVLEIAQTYPDVRDRAGILGNLAQRLPEVTSNAVEAACTIQREDERTRILSLLIYPLVHLPIRELYQIFENMIPVLSRRTRSNLFCDIFTLLPVLLHLGGEGTDQEILQAVRDVSNWWK